MWPEGHIAQLPAEKEKKEGKEWERTSQGLIEPTPQSTTPLAFFLYIWP